MHSINYFSFRTHLSGAFSTPYNSSEQSNLISISVYLEIENVFASNVTVIYICIKIILKYRKDTNSVKNPPKATDQNSVNQSYSLISKSEWKG